MPSSDLLDATGDAVGIGTGHHSLAAAAIWATPADSWLAECPTRGLQRGPI
jgi:hypothetical protein